MFLLIAVGILLAASLAVAVIAYLRHLGSKIKQQTAELYMRGTELEQERSERQEIEHRLRFAEQVRRTMLDSTDAMVVLHGLTDNELPGQFIEVNDAACRLLEYDREKLLSLTPMDIEAAEVPSALLRHGRMQDLSNLVDEIKDLARDRTGVEGDSAFAARQFIRVLREDGKAAGRRICVTGTGRRMPVEVQSILFEVEGAPLVLSTMRDISTRLESEKALRDSERMFRDFFAHSPLGVAVYEAGRSLLDVNTAFLRMFGVPDRAEFARFDLFANPYLPPDAVQKLAAGESVRCEVTFDFDDARNRHLLLSTRKGAAHYELLFSNLGVDAQFRNKGYLVQAVDITRRTATEKALRESEKQLRQAQKMEAIGTLAGGIAHDFNNILTPILGYAEISMDGLEESNPLREYLQEILKAGNRAKELVQQILTFSRQSEDDSQRRPIRVTPIVKEVLALLRAAAPATVEINRVIKTERDVVLADPTQLHQVLMNLCTNARQAIGSAHGQIEVRLTDFVAGMRSRGEFSDLAAGRYLRISVKDTGCGMSAATVERIFEPFFTTKKKGEGTGLGLSVVHGIVAGLGGQIIVESAQGKGSTFHVALPVLEQSTTEAIEADQVLPHGSERVLFVDDDADIARVAPHLLGSLGYECVVVTDPAAAIEVFRAEPQRFAVVITDLLMPGTSGLELARAIREIRPDTPMVLCSGYADRVSPDQASMVGIQAFVAKPMLRKTLAEAIRRAIDGDPVTGS